MRFCKGVGWMTKSFSNLRLTMSPESQLRSQTITEKLMREMLLHHLKQTGSLSQQILTLTQTLDVHEPSFKELEKLADIYLSSLRTHVQAMGGELEIVARFTNKTVRISSFSDFEMEAETDKDAPI